MSRCTQKKGVAKKASDPGPKDATARPSRKTEEDCGSYPNFMKLWSAKQLPACSPNIHGHVSEILNLESTQLAESWKRRTQKDMLTQA